MTSIAHIETASAKRDLRVARGSFIRQLIESEDRSVRYVAKKIGISPTTLAERLAGKNSFLADEIEALAPVLGKTPVVLYSEYVGVGPTGIEPMTSTVKVRHFEPEHMATVTPITKAV